MDQNQPGTDDVLVDFMKKYHAKDPGSFPDVTTSLGCSSYELLATIVEPDSESPPAILDLACGDGLLIEPLLARLGQNCSIWGVDMSEEQIALARERIPEPHVHFSCERAQNLSAADGVMDYVLCHMAFMLMRPVEPVLTEIARVLRPGGSFSAVIGRVGTNVGIDADYVRIMESILEREQPELLATGFGDARVFTMEGLAELVEANGSFHLPIAYRDFFMQLNVPFEGYMTFISKNYFWYVVSPEAREVIRAQLYELFKPGDDQRALVNISLRQFTLIKK